MAVTPLYGLPSPAPTEQADGPTAFENLAEAVEALLSTGTVNLTGGVIQVATGVQDADAASTAQVNAVQTSVDTLAAKTVIGPTGSAPAAGGLPDGSIYYGH